MIWTIMSCVIVPAFTHKMPPIKWRWWVQLSGHFIFVGTPMTWTLSRKE